MSAEHDRFTRDDAFGIVRLLLDVLEAQSGARYAIFDGERGVEGVRDHGDVWVVVWNAADYVATGDRRRMLIDGGPYVVAKEDAAIAMLSSALPLDDALARWRDERRRASL